MSNPYGGQPPYGQPFPPNGAQPYPGAGRPPNAGVPYGAPQQQGGSGSVAAPGYPPQPHAGSQPHPVQPHSASQPQQAQWGAPPAPPQPYGQPPANPYGGQPHPGQPGPYGQPPANPYGGQPIPGQPSPYGQPPANPYGGQPNPGQAGPYGQPGPYGAPNVGAPQGQFLPQPGPQGIVVDASYYPLAFMLALSGPKIIVDGMEVPMAKWGQTYIPVGPGQHHVRVATKWMWDMGPAETVVPVAEGHSTPVYYKSPAVAFINGAIGPGPQQAPGAIVSYICLGVVGVLILLQLLLACSM